MGAEQQGITLRLSRVEKLLRRRTQMESECKTVLGELRPSATFALRFLLSKNVVCATKQDLSRRQMRKIYFTFSAHDSGSWDTLVEYREAGKTHALFSFIITAKDIDGIQSAGKTAKLTFYDGWVVMHG